MDDGRHLENRYDVITCRGWSNLDEIWQVDAESHPDDAKTSKWKPEVEFQYGGHLFSETGNSNISAAD